MDDENTKKEIRTLVDIHYDPTAAEPKFKKPKWFIMQLHPDNMEQKWGILFYIRLDGGVRVNNKVSDRNNIYYSKTRLIQVLSIQL